MRILAVDYGEKRTGLAVSDALGLTAQGLETIKVENESEIPGKIAGVAIEMKVDRIVVGLPINMDGTESQKSAKVREFAIELEALTSLDVVLWDERLTTVQAQRVLHELGVKTHHHRASIDRISAVLILQEYMKTL
jgi:putative Holliday junction resolvase